MNWDRAVAAAVKSEFADDQVQTRGGVVVQMFAHENPCAIGTMGAISSGRRNFYCSRTFVTVAAVPDDKYLTQEPDTRCPGHRRPSETSVWLQRTGLPSSHRQREPMARGAGKSKCEPGMSLRRRSLRTSGLASRLQQTPPLDGLAEWLAQPSSTVVLPSQRRRKRRLRCRPEAPAAPRLQLLQRPLRPLVRRR
jgi:hypothetical protein